LRVSNALASDPQFVEASRTIAGVSETIIVHGHAMPGDVERLREVWDFIDAVLTQRAQGKKD
jgi:hypothetical protein